MRINPDSRFIHGACAAFDAAAVTFLYILCCLPVVTAGAAAASLHTVLLDIARGTSSGGAVPFFRAFREHFGTATRVWLAAAAVGAVLAADAYVCFLLPVGRSLALSCM